MYYQVNDGAQTVRAAVDKPRKLTATRFAAVLGMDEYKTQFQVWCDIMRLYKEDLSGNSYIAAGKILEPRIIEYLRERDTRFDTETVERAVNKVKMQEGLCFDLDSIVEESIFLSGADCNTGEANGTNSFVEKVVRELGVTGNQIVYLTPDEYYGKRLQDCFYDNKIFGGIPDLYAVNANSEIVQVLEIKTFSRFDKWINGAPIKYVCQGEFYAYMLCVDKFSIVGLWIGDCDISSLQELLYYRISPNNIVSYDFSVSDRDEQISADMQKASAWYREYVMGESSTGMEALTKFSVSPMWDRVRDAGYVSFLKDYTCNQNYSGDFLSLDRLNYLNGVRDSYKKKISDLDKEIKKLKVDLKPAYVEGLVPSIYGGIRIDIEEKQTTKYDVTAMKADGVHEKYTKMSKSLNLSIEKCSEALPIQDKFTYATISSSGEITMGKLSKVNNSAVTAIMNKFDCLFEYCEVDEWVVFYVPRDGVSYESYIEYRGIEAQGLCVMVKKDLTDFVESDVFQ